MPDFLTMDRQVESIAHLLSCPDDGWPISRTEGGLCCGSCARVFPVIDGNFVELLPSSPISFAEPANEEYRLKYAELLKESIAANGGAAWGAEELTSRSWRRKRERQVEAVSGLLAQEREPHGAVLCDFAAGAGYYTFAYAKQFRWVLHCDLSAVNLNYCRSKARARNLENIVFLRIDYFRPPFRASLDTVICLDTIIRGEEHDRLLLQSIIRSIRSDGIAVVDFHNWWHNPLRRMGLLA